MISLALLFIFAFAHSWLRDLDTRSRALPGGYSIHNHLTGGDVRKRETYE